MPALAELGVELIEQPLPAGARRRAGRAAAPDPGLRRRILPHRADLDRLRRQVRRGQHQARQDRRADRSAGARRRGARRAGFKIMVGCMIGTSLAMAPAMLLAQQAPHSSISTGRCCWPATEPRGCATTAARVYPPEPALVGVTLVCGLDLRAGSGWRRGSRRWPASRCFAPSSIAPARRASAARRNGFPTLLHIILEQQVSIDAAAAMHRRLTGLCLPLAPEPFLALDDATLRRCGFSRQKMGYARGLAAGGRERRLDFARLAAAPDDDGAGGAGRAQGDRAVERRDLSDLRARPRRYLAGRRSRAAARGRRVPRP